MSKAFLPTYALASCPWRSIAAAVAVAVASVVNWIAATSGSSTLGRTSPALATARSAIALCTASSMCAADEVAAALSEVEERSPPLGRRVTKGDEGCGDKVLTTFHKPDALLQVRVPWWEKLLPRLDPRGLRRPHLPRFLGFTSTNALEMNSSSRSARQQGNRAGSHPFHHTLVQSHMELLRGLKEVAPSLEHHILGTRHRELAGYFPLLVLGVTAGGAPFQRTSSQGEVFPTTETDRRSDHLATLREAACCSRWR